LRKRQFVGLLELAIVFMGLLVSVVSEMNELVLQVLQLVLEASCPDVALFEHVDLQQQQQRNN
jgi:hypothetical protein